MQPTFAVARARQAIDLIKQNTHGNVKHSVSSCKRYYPPGPLSLIITAVVYPTEVAWVLISKEAPQPQQNSDTEGQRPRLTCNERNVGKQTANSKQQAGMHPAGGGPSQRPVTPHPQGRQGHAITLLCHFPDDRG